MKRRSVLLALGSTSMAAVVGSNAFSETRAEREIDVAVARDADAYLSLKHGDGDGGDLVFSQGDDPFEPPVSLRVENRVTVPLDVTIDISSGDAVLRDAPGGSDTGSLEFALDVGDDKKIKIDFDGFGSIDAELDIIAEGGGQSDGGSQVRIEAIRTVSLQRGIDGVDFNGGGNVEIDSSYDGEIDVRLMYLSANEKEDGKWVLSTAEICDSNGSITVDTTEKIRGQLPNTCQSGQIVAIHFPELDEVYVHPQVEHSEEEELISNFGTDDGVLVTEGYIHDEFTDG